MNAERNFPIKKPAPKDDFDLDEILDQEEKAEKEKTAQEALDLINEQKKKDRLSRPQNIMIGRLKIETLKSRGEVELSGINFYDRVINPGDKVILVGENEKIEAEFVRIIGPDPTSSKAVVIKVRLPN